MVELKKTPSLLLADGVKSEGVTLCARITPARATKNIEKVRCMMKGMGENRSKKTRYIFGIRYSVTLRVR